jgi:biopolymer transport protein ExbD
MRIRGRLRPSAEIPQASLADIAFLLLIFFLSITVLDTEAGIPLVLPAAGTRPVRLHPDNVLAIVADSEGRVTVDGRPAEPGEIRERVEARLRDNPDLVVSMETDPRARYDVMVRILDAVKLARAERIALRPARR